jgi:prepilin-type N-terminal cleavage/methylation domain-containing protein
MHLQRGQSLIEIMIAVVVGGVLVGGATALISVILQSGAQGKFFQSATLLNRDLYDKVEVFSQSRWAGVSDLYDTDAISTFTYYIDSTTTPGAFIASPHGTWEVISLDGIDFTRFFTIASTSRNTVGDFVDPFNSLLEDPSTKIVTITTSWNEPTSSGSLETKGLITRHQNALFQQSDWSGGDGEPGPVTQKTLGNRFDVSNSIDWSTRGSITIQE